MSTPIFPFEVWTSQITQASIPANNNSLRVEVLETPAIAIANSSTSTNEGDVFIVGDTPAGDFATFTSNNVVIYKSGVWLEFDAFDGWLKMIGTDLYSYDGTAWTEVVSGGGGGGTPTYPEVVDITASETLNLTRANKFINASHATVAIVITVPNDTTANFDVNTEIHIRSGGDAAVSIAPEDGTITIEQPASQTLTIAEKFGVITIKKVAANKWAAFGMLTAV